MNNKGKAWLYGALAWLIPGAGHIAQKRYGRGVLLGAVILTMFVAGRWLGGDLHSITDSSAGLLQQFFGIFNLGTGVLYLFSWMNGFGFNNIDSAQQTTFEYGNTFLMVAGLLNYLVMLDAYDIGAGRKQ